MGSEKQSTVVRALRLAVFKPLTLVSILILLAVLLGAIFAPWLAPADPLKGNLRYRALGPTAQFLLGTDAQGRDIFSRILYGARGTLQIGAISMLFGGVGGAIVGVIGAYFRRFDLVVMRIVDVMLSFPSVLVALALAGVMGPGQMTLTIALAVASFPSATRIARSAALTVVHREYVESARAIGLPTHRILRNYVLRNCAPEVIAYLTLQFGQVMLMAVSLSFLGLGTRPPIPELGSMIGDGRALLFSAPHVALFPTAVVFLLVMSVNLLGDALRDRLDSSKL